MKTMNMKKNLMLAAIRQAQAADRRRARDRYAAAILHEEYDSDHGGCYTLNDVLPRRWWTWSPAALEAHVCNWLDANCDNGFSRWTAFGDWLSRQWDRLYALYW